MFSKWSRLLDWKQIYTSNESESTGILSCQFCVTISWPAVLSEPRYVLLSLHHRRLQELLAGAEPDAEIFLLPATHSSASPL